MPVVSSGGADAPCHSLSIDDDRYPQLLREIHDPPECLHVRGDVAALARPQLAIVGSRRASSAGLRLAAQLARALGEAGLQICSGLARGVDGAAHQGALQAGAPTLAVMATGIDNIYPRQHRGLAAHIVANGCVVTEFAEGMQPRRENFPRRNRIISGLSLGVLVVEAANASGSLITARCALEHGREVFALPWSPLHAGGAGCLSLLQDGAKMVLTVDDILEELGPLYALTQGQAKEPAAPDNNSEGGDSALLSLLGYEVVALDDVVAALARPVPEVLGELTALELAGVITQVPGGYIRT